MSWQGIRQALGPGLLYAGAAVGVSHVVQSTRAGALYGFALIGFVLLVNLLKYPFFEFGSRYTRHTGQNLLQAYRQLGRGVLPLFLLLSLLTMFPIMAAISAVFAGIVQQVLLPGAEPLALAAGGIGCCVLILWPGKYTWLDRAMKIIMLLLSITTVVAVVAALGQTEAVRAAAAAPLPWNRPLWLFLIAFAGWMPTPIDASVWQSLWAQAKRAKHASLENKHISFDFKLGYFVTTILAVFFLMLGGLVLYGSGEELPAQGAAFAASFVRMYVGILGNWAYPVIAFSVLATLFSTLLTVLDAYPRVLVAGWELLRPTQTETIGPRNIYWGLVLLLAAGSLLLLWQFGANMLALVDFATSVSFLAAPLLAWWNLRVMRLPSLAAADRPKRPLMLLAWIGFAALLLFSGIYLSSLLRY